MCAMKATRTRNWWLIRLELALGIVLTLLVALLGLHASLQFHFGLSLPMMLGPLQLQPNAAIALGALLIAVVGLIWMVRIIRGPGDEPPPRWRYREVNWRYRES
jgi:nitrate reductase NapE component